MFGMHLDSFTCKMLFLDRQGDFPALTLRGGRLEIVNSFLHVGSCISDGRNVGNEILLRTSKVNLAFVNLRHLHSRRSTRLSKQDEAYNVAVRLAMPCRRETWLLREDLRRLTMFDHHCLRYGGQNSDEARRTAFEFDRISRKGIDFLRQLQRPGLKNAHPAFPLERFSRSHWTGLEATACWTADDKEK